MTNSLKCHDFFSIHDTISNINDINATEQFCNKPDGLLVKMIK